MTNQAMQVQELKYQDPPHGMITTQADIINADLLAFIKG
jgi:hypothetical protein